MATDLELIREAIGDHGETSSAGATNGRLCFGRFDHFERPLTGNHAAPPQLAQKLGRRAEVNFAASATGRRVPQLGHRHSDFRCGLAECLLFFLRCGLWIWRLVCCACEVQRWSTSALGSVRSFEPFAQMAALSRLAVIHDRKLEVLVLDDCFHQHRTFVKNWRAAELRTFLPVVDAAKLTIARRPNLGICRHSAACFAKSSRSKLSKWAKSETDVCCAGFGCLTC